MIPEHEVDKFIAVFNAAPLEERVVILKYFWFIRSIYYESLESFCANTKICKLIKSNKDKIIIDVGFKEPISPDALFLGITFSKERTLFEKCAHAIGSNALAWDELVVAIKVKDVI